METHSPFLKSCRVPVQIYNGEALDLMAETERVILIGNVPFHQIHGVHITRLNLAKCTPGAFADKASNTEILVDGKLGSLAAAHMLGDAADDPLFTQETIKLVVDGKFSELDAYRSRGEMVLVAIKCRTRHLAEEQLPTIRHVHEAVNWVWRRYYRRERFTTFQRFCRDMAAGGTLTPSTCAKLLQILTDPQGENFY